MSKKLRIIMALAISMMVVLSFSGMVLAEAYEFPSTNDQNRDKQVPGREGQDAPHVNLIQAGEDFVELEFVNNTNSLAFFEYRIDGEEITGGTPHPVVTGCFIYPGVTVDGRGIDEPVIVNRTFEANSKVEIRLALGGERDWDFDWTEFLPLGPPTVLNITQETSYYAIQPALNEANQGDVIHVLPGDYTNEGIIMNRTPDLFIEGITEDEETPKIDQLWNFGASGATIKGFVAERIRVYGSGISDVAVEHNTVNTISVTAGTNHSIAHNILQGDAYYGITLAPGVSQTSIVHNHVSGKTGGIRLGDANYNADDNTVAHNTVIDGSIGVWVRGVDNNVHHNLICGNRTADIRVQEGSIGTHIHNNTFGTIQDWGDNTRLRRNTDCTSAE